MLNNFIYAKKKSLFENALNNGLVPDEAIVFIKNTKEIWNHGTYFDGSTFDPSNIEKSIEDIIKDKADKIELPTKVSDLENDSNYVTESELANVAKSGSYNDLSNKPNIPSEITESTVNNWGFTKNTGTYNKPSSGIPKSDLDNSIQLSLNKADSATYYLELQEDISEQGIYTGTLTQELIAGIQSCKNLIIKFSSDPINEITFNWNIDAESYRTYSNLHINSELLWIVYHLFAVNFNNYSYELVTKHIYIDFDMFDVDNQVSLKTKQSDYKLYIPVDTTEGFISANEYSLAINSLFLKVQYGIHEILFIQKSAPEAYPGLYYYYSYCMFDDNNRLFITLSLIESEGLYGYSIVTKSVNTSGTTSVYPTVYHGTSDPTYTLTPNTFHIWDEVTTLDLDLGEETELIANEYLFLFTSGSTATSLSLPDNIKWSDEFIIEVNKIYQISILNGLGTVMSWSI